MDWKSLLGSLSESANDDLRLRIEYLTAENRMLRQQIKDRGRLSDADRKALGEIGRQLGRKSLAEIATVTQPDTIVAWGRTFADTQVVSLKPRKSVGRPRIDREIEDLVIRMARRWFVFPDVYPRPIRDGPIRRYQRLSNHDQRKAA